MDILAINGSPHMNEGNTAKILNPFLEGLKEAGANVELIYSWKLNIEPCSGDMSCWFVNPGTCAKDDDMKTILPKIKNADVIVWASPVYYSGITGPLKTLMDRQLPAYVMGQPRSKMQKAVLVSTCSAWEISMFDPLLVQMKAIYDNPQAGETALIEGIFKAAKQAGHQLIKDGRISEDMEKAVSRELMPRDAYYRAAQEMIEQMRTSQ